MERKRIIKEYKYEGYVSKRTVADFEVGETDEIDNQFTYEEYLAFSDKQKKAIGFIAGMKRMMNTAFTELYTKN